MAKIQNVVETRFTTRGGEKVAKETESIGRAQTRLGQASAASGRQFSAQASGMGGLVAAYAGAAANIFALTMAFNALATAARAEETIAGVRTLAASVGESGDQVLSKLKEITQGQVSMAEAAASANLALSAGFSLDQIEGLATVATKASKALGRDLTDSLNRLVRGAAKVEPEILDELGIIVRLDKAVDQYAQKIGKAASELTLFERSQAFTNAIITQGTQKFSVIDETAASSIKTFEQLSAKFLDLAQQIGGLVAGALGPVVEFITGNFLNTLSAAGLVGGIIFQKLGEVGGAALNNIADRAAAAGTSVTNFLGKGGATAAANTLTEATKELKFSGEKMKGQFTGISAEARRTAISLLAKSKTTKLTAQELIRLKNALKGAKFANDDYKKAVDAATASTARLGIASKVASVGFNIAAKGVTLLARGFSFLLGAFGKIFFYVSIIQLLSSTLGKLIFGVDLFAKAGKQLEEFFSTYRERTKRAEQVTQVFLAVLSKVPDQVAKTNQAIQNLKLTDNPIFGDKTELTGAKAAENLQKQFAAAAAGMDISKLVGVKKLKGGGALIENFLETFEAGPGMRGEIRRVIMQLFPGEKLLTEADAKKIGQATTRMIIENILKGFDNVEGPAKKLLEDFARDIERLGPKNVEGIKRFINQAIRATNTPAAVAETFGDGLKEGVVRFGDDAQKTFTELAKSEGLKSLGNVANFGIDVKKIGEESGQEFSKLVTALDKFGQSVKTGQITVESFTKETAIQDRIMEKLMETLLGAGPPTSDFALKVQKLMEAFKKARPAIQSFAMTLDFLNKSFDIKGLGKFREFIDGSGKIATTARELKEAKFDQLFAILDKLPEPTKRTAQQTDIYNRSLKAIAALYPDLVKGVDKILKTATKTNAEYAKQLDLLTQTTNKIKAQNTLNKLASDKKIETEQLKMQQDLSKQAGNLQKAQLDTVKAFLDVQTQISNEKMAEIGHSQQLLDLELERNKEAAKRANDILRQELQLQQNVASTFSNLFSQKQLQGMEIEALKIDVKEAREFLALEQARDKEARAAARAIEAEKVANAERAFSNELNVLNMRSANLDRQEKLLNAELANAEAAIKRGDVGKEFEARKKLVDATEQSAKINAEAAHASREITLKKMQADMAFLSKMATTMQNHSQGLATTFKQHVDALARTIPGAGQGAGASITGPGGALDTISADAAKAADLIGSSTGTRTGAFAQSDAIRKAQIGNAKSQADAQRAILTKEAKLRKEQALANVERLKNELAIIKENRLEVTQLKDLNEERRNAAIAGAERERELAIQSQKDKIKAAEQEVANAETALTNQQRLNKIINNDLNKLLDNLSGKIQDRLGGAVEDFFTAIKEGTLTMENFKQGVKDLFIGILDDIATSTMEEFVINPMKEFVKEQLGGFLQGFGGGTSPQQAVVQAIQNQTGVSQQIAQTAQSNLKDVFDKQMSIFEGLGMEVQRVQVVGGIGGIGSPVLVQDFADPTGSSLDLAGQTASLRQNVKTTGQSTQQTAKNTATVTKNTAAAVNNIDATKGVTAAADTAAFSFENLADFAGIAGAGLGALAGGLIGGPAGSAVGSIVGMIAGQGLKMLAGSLFGGGPGTGMGIGGIASGGLVHMASGGQMRDRVPALLEPGEFVIRKPMAKAIGGPALSAMNAHGTMPNNPNVVVNMNNQGTPQESEGRPNVQVTPEAIIVDIVTRDMQNNGPIRRSIRGNLS